MPRSLSKLEETIRQKGLDWKVRNHPLARLPAEEQRRQLLPHAPAAEVAAQTRFHFLPRKLPRAFDWRNVNGRSYVTPPKDQSGIPVCIAYAVTGAVESNFLLTLDPFLSNLGELDSSIDLSEQALVSLNKNYPSVREFLLETGMPPDDLYKQGSAAPVAGWQLKTVSVTECLHYEGLSMDEVKALLVSGGPFVAGLNVPYDFYSYGGGVYASTTSSIAGFHLVLVVGYDNGQKYFICKNSWGQGWGENGYFRIAYSEFQAGNTGFGVLIDTYTGVRVTSPVRTPLALKTANGNYLTMVNGGGIGGRKGGRGIEALHTNATQVGPFEVFELDWIDEYHFAIRTANGNYLTAANGGGVGCPTNASCPVRTDATVNGPWERLYLSYNDRTGKASLQTADGHYLTAVNGGGVGGLNRTPVRTDAMAIGPWETFSMELAVS